MWKRSAIWSFLIVFLLALGAWLFSEVNHSAIWPIIGLFVGLISELGVLITEWRKMERITNTLVLIFAGVFVLAVLLSIYFSELYGCVAGMLFPVVITLLIYQMCKKRIITWDEIINVKSRTSNE